ncbi:SIP domain-containing protein [Roseibium sp.]|uniref:SIP domain-containing protein n=1 Tax=Roseibium sp. TaxID=1936156 RepID=UPI003A96C5A9
MANAETAQSPEFKFRSSLVLNGLDKEQAAGFLRHQAEHHNLSLTQSSDGQLECVTPFGIVRLDTSGASPSLSIEAPSADILYAIQEDITSHLSELSETLASALTWSSIFSVGDYPPNFRLAEVVSVGRVNPIYTRVRIKADKLGNFANAGMHFRLIIPASGAVETDVYPVIGDNGQTVWPKGDKALHRPVYTTRAIDPAKGWLEFDVFHHDGGRANAWTKTAQPGTRLALMGPGGGTLLDTDKIVMAGDETALPAISRILRHLPATATGKVFMLVSDETEQVEITAPEGIELNWLHRSEARPRQLLQAVTALPDQAPGTYAWFASEKSEVKAARAHFTAQGWFDKEQSYLAAFWTAH